MNETVYLGLGSNRENRLWYIVQTLRQFATIPALELRNISSIYETEPYGVTDQRDFLNAVFEITTDFPPGRLLHCVKFIERKVGRIDRGIWGSREIDIDILTFGSKIIHLPWLNIPHIELHKRRFVLIPFAELAPDFIVPRYNRSVVSLLQECPDRGRVAPLISRVEMEEQLKTMFEPQGIAN